MNGRRVSWPQAVVSAVAIAAAATVLILCPDGREMAAAIFGSAVTAGVGAFRGG
jgi:hypothetical protein